MKELALTARQAAPHIRRQSRDVSAEFREEFRSWVREAASMEGLALRRGKAHRTSGGEAVLPRMTFLELELTWNNPQTNRV
ncbi:MAG: hypothetical protein WAL47_00220 [Pyrinomonadaceae bacterium]